MSILHKDTTLTKIFVGGLPYHTTDDTLRQFFDRFGEIEEAVVITDRQTGKSRGYGFVTMADRIAAERACKDPNPIIDGRKANVNLAYLGAKPRTLAHDILAAAFPLGVKAVPIPNGYANQLTRLQPYCPPSGFLTAAGPALTLSSNALPMAPAPVQSTVTSSTTNHGGLSLDYSSPMGYQSYPVIYGLESLPSTAGGQVIGFITPNGSIVPATMATGTPASYSAGMLPGTLTGMGQSFYPLANATCYQQQAIHERMQ